MPRSAGPAPLFNEANDPTGDGGVADGGVADLGNLPVMEPSLIQSGGMALLPVLQVMSPMYGEVEQNRKITCSNTLDYAQHQPTLPRQDTSQIEGFQSKKSELRKRPYEVPDEHPVHHRSPSPVVLEPEGAGTEVQEVSYGVVKKGKGSGLKSGGMNAHTL